MPERKNNFFGFVNKNLHIVCAMILILFAGCLLWFNNSTSMQAIPAMVADVYFDGEYLIGDGVVLEHIVVDLPQESIEALKVASGKTVSQPTAPVKEGFVFGGWFTDKELTKEFDFESPVTKATTLYAKWTEKVKKNIVLAIGSAEADINGEKVAMDASPVIVNERAMLPIRFIAETLGAKVIWEPETKTVKISLLEIEISLVVGESKATVNGEEIALDTESFIKDDRTYLPVRFVMENLGEDVAWNAENNTVTIAEK